MIDHTHSALKDDEPEERDFELLLQKARKLDEKQRIDTSFSDTEASFRNVCKEADIGQTSPQKKLYFWKYAAIAAIVVMGAVGLSYLFTPHLVKVSAGQIQTIQLSDGSAVTLNSGSTLSYPRWFGIWGRTVSLRGEAFFDVSHTGSPFQVKAGDARIKVMGTKFDVHSWMDQGIHKTSVFLEEGKVKFLSRRRKKHSIILQPGQYSWISDEQKSPAQPQQVKSSTVMAWMPRKLFYKNTSLSTIFDDLSRRFNVHARFKPDSLSAEKLTIYLSKVKNAEQTIADICRAKGLNYIKQGDTFIISDSY